MRLTTDSPPLLLFLSALLAPSSSNSFLSNRATSGENKTLGRTLLFDAGEAGSTDVGVAEEIVVVVLSRFVAAPPSAEASVASRSSMKRSIIPRAEEVPIDEGGFALAFGVG